MGRFLKSTKSRHALKKPSFSFENQSCSIKGALSQSGIPFPQNAATTPDHRGVLDVAEKLISAAHRRYRYESIKPGRYANDIGQQAHVRGGGLTQLKMDVKIGSTTSADPVGQRVTITADVLGRDSVQGVVSRISPTGEHDASSKEMVIPVQIDGSAGKPPHCRRHCQARS